MFHRHRQRAVTGRAKAAGIEWPPPEEMGDRAIREVVYPPKSKADPDKAPIDHDHVDAEMPRPGVTMMLLWSEYCESAVSQGRLPNMYSAFCERHRKWAMSHKTAMRIAHKPAEQMQVNYVGDTMEVVNTDAGEVLKVYVFAACLPFSGKLYAKGSYDMREEPWVDAHVSAFSFFGGTTPILVPDNLKQGVVKHTVDELVISEQYRRMAEHYGCAVVPGRPRRPRCICQLNNGPRGLRPGFKLTKTPTTPPARGSSAGSRSSSSTEGTGAGSPPRGSPPSCPSGSAGTGRGG